MLERGEFLEAPKCTATATALRRSGSSETRARGLDILLEIDWQGAQQVRRAFPDAIGIFILPPLDAAELERRLRKRGQDSEEVIRRRLRTPRRKSATRRSSIMLLLTRSFEEARRDLAAVVRASPG